MKEREWTFTDDDENASVTVRQYDDGTRGLHLIKGEKLVEVADMTPDLAAEIAAALRPEDRSTTEADTEELPLTGEIMKGVDFDDDGGRPCSLQESSGERPGIWFGRSDVEGRALLSPRLAAGLWPHLKRFAETQKLTASAWRRLVEEDLVTIGDEIRPRGAFADSECTVTDAKINEHGRQVAWKGDAGLGAQSVGVLIAERWEIFR